MSRPIGTAAELERRRRRAVALLHQGEPAATIARILGVHETSVHRWRRQAQGDASLAAKALKGPKPKLSAAQGDQVRQLLLQGAMHHGWPNDLWTADRVTRLIQAHFDVTYHPEHVRAVLKRRLGFTSQQPQRRAREQNDKEVARWVDDEFQRILREAHARDAHLVFLDEAGFMLTPTVRRTLAPRGQTPVLTTWQRHDRISVISCVTLHPTADRPGLYFELLPAGLNATAEDVVAFLRSLRQERPGPLTVVWDRSKTHSKATVVQAYLATQPDVVVEDLPPYAPALNPDEMVWAWVKYGRLPNLAPQDVRELRDRVETELAWAAFDGELLAGFINHAHLGIAL